MFGESESESPRVPSPWDNLVSSSPSPLSRSPIRTPSNPNLSPPQTHDPIHTILPRLVPEADDGNVEYKLQLLSPSPSRFARLATQLKWRLLEGGGQAYYELGVADSGALVGLSRAEMEMSLETLEMMAGEIGASVIVVKEIEVPEAMMEAVKAQQAAGILLGEEKWMRTKKRNGKGARVKADEGAEETDGDNEGLHQSNGCAAIFSMDLAEPEDAEDEQGLLMTGDTQPLLIVDLEISSVFKPRPFRTRLRSTQSANRVGKNKWQKKQYKPSFLLASQSGTRNDDGDSTVKLTQDEGATLAEQGRNPRNRRQIKDQTRLMQNPNFLPSPSPSPSPMAPTPPPTQTVLATAEETDVLLSGLEGLHVSIDMNEDMSSVGVFMEPEMKVFPRTPAPTPAAAGTQVKAMEAKEDMEDDDVFSAITRRQGGNTGRGHDANDKWSEEDGKRVIVEALVVRKMSLEEAFLDFEVFS
ncbi:hypothetical protein AX17_004313 [Amanita inopinata Kibby_2008]|nr:hypothetical protein AX17_004313 [Amanita inopinata Kibby_2008]